jgi:energy-converting hydrogenase Eha subunit A
LLNRPAEAEVCKLMTVVLALALAAEPVAVDRPARLEVKVAAFSGAGLLTLGVVFEIIGRTQGSAHDTIGAVGLISAGLSLITVAALLTPWRIPNVAIVPTPGGGVMFAFGGQWR